MTRAGSVLFVHGLWMTGAESVLLRQRLERRGYEARTFHYASLHAELGEVLGRLAGACAALEPPVHLVGHSLGGLLVVRLLDSPHPLPPGRAVLLGSPVAGSAAARAVARWPVGSTVLGRLALGELTVPAATRGPPRREVGVIAGSLSAGLGRVVTDLPEPNDGTVAVRETALPGAASQCVLPVSHTSMLFSAAVAEAVATFLACGRFAPEDGGRSGLSC